MMNNSRLMEGRGRNLGVKWRRKWSGMETQELSFKQLFETIQ